MDTKCVKTCKSHLHTCRLHKTAVVFTVFPISESHAVSLHYHILHISLNYHSYTNACKYMNVNEAFFCPGKLHASICGLVTPPSFCTVSVCRIQDPVLFISGYLYIFLADSRRTDILSIQTV